MAHSREVAISHLEWRITATDVGVSGDNRAPEASSGSWNPWLALESFIKNSFSRIWKFLNKAWSVAVDDPKKVIHCVKVGLALTVVSFFYYMRPLYDGVGGTAMWAVLTVVVAFEYYVGATLAKCLNRVTGTFLAGFVALGVQWVAKQSGEEIEPIIRDFSVFLLASLATFSRFIPAVKAKFDYGAMVFVLTFTLISVSGYRVEKLFEMARDRLLTIVIGTSFCILISMFLFPAWAGDQLHALITRNMEKLANSLQCCITKYCDLLDETTTAESDNSSKDLLAYRCVLNTKASEESLANFARWEPGHGSFKFQHPWKQYLKIGAAMRSFAYCIEALNSCISDKTKDSKHMGSLGNIYLKLSSSSSEILRELARSMKTMTKFTNKDVLVEQLKLSIEELQDFLHISSFSSTKTVAKFTGTEHNKASDSIVSLLELQPLVSYASLLIEIVSRIEDIVDVVQELANMAEFKKEDDHKGIQIHCFVFP